MQVPEGIDPGWAYNPGKAGWSQIEKAANAKIAATDGLFEDLPRAWPPAPTSSAQVQKLADDIARGQAEWEKSLTAAEKEAIETYKGDGYRLANAVLRDDGDVLDEFDDDDIAAAHMVIDDLSGGLKRAKLPKAVTTFRGIPEDLARTLFGKVKAGDIVTDPGFFSSSLSSAVAGKFGPFVIEVRMPAGMPAVALVHFIPDINHVEFEMLLAAGIPMKVVDVQPGRLIVEVQTAWQTNGNR